VIAASSAATAQAALLAAFVFFHPLVKQTAIDLEAVGGSRFRRSRSASDTALWNGREQTFDLLAVATGVAIHG